MVQIFLCESFTTLLLLSCGNGADFTVLRANLCCARSQWKLLPTLPRFLVIRSSLVYLYHFLVVNEYYLLNIVAYWYYLTNFLYLDVTLCHFFSSYGCALASLWSSHSWDLLFPWVFWTFLDVSFTSSSCSYLFMFRSNLFQTFGLSVSPHIFYNTYITPGNSTSTVSCSCDGSWKGCCNLAHCMTLTWWFYKLYIYIALDGSASSYQLNVYSAWRRY